MNRLDRLTSILLQLQSKRLITAREIATRFEVTNRTIYRDIQTLRLAGVPIGEEEGKSYFLVETIAATGHYPMIEKPTEFNLLMEKVLREMKLTAVNE